MEKEKSAILKQTLAEEFNALTTIIVMLMKNAKTTNADINLVHKMPIVGTLTCSSAIQTNRYARIKNVMQIRQKQTVQIQTILTVTKNTSDVKELLVKLTETVLQISSATLIQYALRHTAQLLQMTVVKKVIKSVILQQENV